MADEQKQPWEPILADYQRTVKTYSTMSALHTVAEYWVETENIIEQAAVKEVEQNGPKWQPDSNDDDSIGEFLSEKDLARYTHDQVLIPMHRFSSIVMLYTTVERELLRLVENLEKVRGEQKLKLKDVRANSKVGQISKFCEVFFNLRLVDCPQYAALTDLQKIRDCIVHCLGDVNLSGDKDYLEELEGKRSGFYAHAQGQIYIYEKCIQQFLLEVWSLFTWVFQELSWEIGAHWRGDKLGDLFKGLKVR